MHTLSVHYLNNAHFIGNQQLFQVSENSNTNWPCITG